MGFNFRPLHEADSVMDSGTRWEVVTRSPEETIQLGYELAKRLRPPCLVLLEGELGSGKTTLVKGIVAGLGAAREEEVTSPSFTLVHEYGQDQKVYHADLYRVEGTREFATLGLDDLLERQATVIVEWGEKIPGRDVEAQVIIHMELLDGEERRIAIEELGQ
jgi:tRNA threonylcarbamoyladenosine biosynthesis protein TsaE